jgi:hypothetical protein
LTGQVVELRPAAAVEDVSGPGALEVATLAELAAVARTATPLGVLLLKLAGELDRSAGATAQRLAGEYRKARVDALEGSSPVADVVNLIFASDA